MPPSHFPRCSVTDIFSEVFRQSENRDARKASRFFPFGRKYLCGIDKIHCFYILETYVTCGHRPLRSAFGGVRPTRRCGAGGYAIRPYEHAPGPLVGAAFMAARTRFRFPPRFDDSARRRGAHGASATLRVQGTPPAALSSVHAVGADCISARAAPPIPRRLAAKHTGPSGGHTGRPYRSCSVGRGAHTPPHRTAGRRTFYFRWALRNAWRPAKRTAATGQTIQVRCQALE